MKACGCRSLSYEMDVGHFIFRAQVSSLIFLKLSVMSVGGYRKAKKPFFCGRESRQHPPTYSIMIFKCQYIFNWFIFPPPLQLPLVIKAL